MAKLWPPGRRLQSPPSINPAGTLENVYPPIKSGTMVMISTVSGEKTHIMTMPCKPMLIGIAADHGGYELKEYLSRKLREARFEVIDFGDRVPDSGDDYPYYVVPLARAVAGGDVDRGVAICGSGVGASVVANKVPGVRACLIHETFSAHQGVEDDDLNMICLGGLVVGHALALELVQTFLTARFSDAERHRRRLAKVTDLEQEALSIIRVTDAPIQLPSDASAMDAWRNEGDPN